MTNLYIAQGEDAVGRSEDMVITTILGSCISICLWDPVAGVGGMNHLLLPEMHQAGSLSTSGAVAMDRLINRMMPLGAVRPRLRGKLFGGSSMLQGRTDIGARNAAFGQAYLKTEGIPCDAENVGGTRARKLRFFPATGVAQLKFVEEAPRLKTPKVMPSNDVELF
ncbi:chemotaxis protein CheD [Silicimonas algicola]|uniref:Probable chemoreceptor glutamine deamidase CheD n=1 Tax=Silicimonas algicola TaxID=1826607 RepID=A0A316GD89_9RHOB|nr:chemotaxis protein CheD [Silicimonas algicola]AZQ67662.1 chemotaxis protein CheD [Silicimonas algicola]PWK57936.1 chemotaxis protein CheD [Silicimonas algicola]